MFRNLFQLCPQLVLFGSLLPLSVKWECWDKWVRRAPATKFLPTADWKLFQERKNNTDLFIYFARGLTGSLCVSQPCHHCFAYCYPSKSLYVLCKVRASFLLYQMRGWDYDRLKNSMTAPQPGLKWVLCNVCLVCEWLKGVNHSAAEPKAAQRLIFSQEDSLSVFAAILCTEIIK
jgi:hypothetical protein